MSNTTLQTHKLHRSFPLHISLSLNRSHTDITTLFLSAPSKFLLVGFAHFHDRNHSLTRRAQICKLKAHTHFFDSFPPSCYTITLSGFAFAPICFNWIFLLPYSSKFNLSFLGVCKNSSFYFFSYVGLIEICLSFVIMWLFSFWDISFVDIMWLHVWVATKFGLLASINIPHWQLGLNVDFERIYGMKASCYTAKVS